MNVVPLNIIPLLMLGAIIFIYLFSWVKSTQSLYVSVWFIASNQRGVRVWGVISWFNETHVDNFFQVFLDFA